MPSWPSWTRRSSTGPVSSPSPTRRGYAANLAGHVPPTLVAERLRECSEAQDVITAAKRNALVGTRCLALVGERGQARSHRGAPEIDGIISVPADLPVGSWAQLEITGGLWARTWWPCPWRAALAFG